MPKKTYPNQFNVKISPREHKGAFCIVGQDALYNALNNLKLGELKLWLYLNKNKDNYELALSQKDCGEWGIPKTTYQNAKDGLIEKGYLIEKSENNYIFIDNPEQSQIGIKNIEQSQIGIAQFLEEHLSQNGSNDMIQSQIGAGNNTLSQNGIEQMKSVESPNLGQNLSQFGSNVQFYQKSESPNLGPKESQFRPNLSQFEQRNNIINNNNTTYQEMKESVGGVPEITKDKLDELKLSYNYVDQDNNIIQLEDGRMFKLVYSGYFNF